jgi:alpha-amylase/alpha-mannosidase (GH57 family)
MATISFLWHLHQPAYRTADGVSHAPWVALHAGGTYTTLARAIEAGGGRGQILNIVPTLLEQLLAYRDGTVADPVIEAIVTPAGDLTATQREGLLAWGGHVNPRQFERYPRLAELARRRPAKPANNRLDSRFGRGDLRDLQILFVLAQAGEQAWTDERLVPLYSRGRNYGADDHRAMSEWLLAQPGELVDLWRRVGALAGVEISTSPYAHPIMPLLIDSAIVVDSWAPHPAPAVPVFRHREDAVWQLEHGLAFMREHGFETGGCWPPEGSVSSDAVDVYAGAGVKWLVTDEGILERSLGRPLRNGGAAEHDLYRPWLAPGGGPVLFFRDRHLSDAIGFQYGSWHDEGVAALDLVRKLEELSRSLPDDACITIALDGENPWLYYPEGGGRFLRELFDRLKHHPSKLRPATLTDAAAAASPASLDRLHPGSWINSIFATWIGHHEKIHAWEVLAAVRTAIAGAGGDRPPSLLLAEGSDWFWWLGDDNPTALAPLYDRIFRQHLADACAQAGIESPVDLAQALKTATQRLRVPVSASWPAPILDGRVTTYFEWSLAQWITSSDDGPLRRLAVWGGRDRLHLLVEGSSAVKSLLNGDRLVIRLTAVDGTVTEIAIGHRETLPSQGACAVGRIAELSLPWDGQSGSRLEVRLGEWQLPAGGALLLEPYAVDREYDDGGRKE